MALPAFMINQKDRDSDLWTRGLNVRIKSIGYIVLHCDAVDITAAVRFSTSPALKR